MNTPRFHRGPWILAVLLSAVACLADDDLAPLSDEFNHGPTAAIQVARIGPHVITLRRAPGGARQVHRRYPRPDMPARLQVGLTVYTDWSLCERVGFAAHNRAVLTNGAALPAGGGIVTGANPDLAASFAYVRYRRPQVPGALASADLSNPGIVSDAQLLAFLGANASHAHAPPPAHLSSQG